MACLPNGLLLLLLSVCHAQHIWNLDTAEAPKPSSDPWLPNLQSSKPAPERVAPVQERTLEQERQAHDFQDRVRQAEASQQERPAPADDIQKPTSPEQHQEAPAVARIASGAVSYTHLTLPTKRIV
eukprot:TRINITY_DN28627_c0_g1_i2.p2 TRINITY_DN28627_c0_g1~~TRINITY_DN28627_c0_g1_i2.p2  ORF type:complete len:126 (-),score=24.55 TRINITY_DN28627_c0_g1_i2:96-473(-)